VTNTHRISGSLFCILHNHLSCETHMGTEDCHYPQCCNNQSPPNNNNNGKLSKHPSLLYHTCGNMSHRNPVRGTTVRSAFYCMCRFCSLLLWHTANILPHQPYTRLSSRRHCKQAHPFAKDPFAHTDCSLQSNHGTFSYFCILAVGTRYNYHGTQYSSSACNNHRRSCFCNRIPGRPSDTLWF